MTSPSDDSEPRSYLEQAKAGMARAALDYVRAEISPRKARKIMKSDRKWNAFAEADVTEIGFVMWTENENVRAAFGDSDQGLDDFMEFHVQTMLGALAVVAGPDL